MIIDRQAIAKNVKKIMANSNAALKPAKQEIAPAKKLPKIPAPKLILDPEVKQHVEEILAPLLAPDLWKSLGLSFAPNPHAIILLEGEPGTGKTALANYIARKFRKLPVSIDAASILSADLGNTEKTIKAVFQEAWEKEANVVIIEECDSLLWTRDKVSEDTMHVLGFVNTLLTQIDLFKNRGIPSVLILITNYPKLLDAALLSRITDKIVLASPKNEQALKMWESKLPDCIMQSMAVGSWVSLKNKNFFPRQIENMILKVCRKALLEKRQPTFADFQF